MNKDAKLGGHVDIGGIAYPLMKVNKSEFNRLKVQLDGVKGIPRYCCYLDDNLAILPESDQHYNITTCFDDTDWYPAELTVQSST